MKAQANDYFKKVEDISQEYLIRHNITGIILDIDNTIAVDGKTEMFFSVIEWINNIGLPVCLLSNGKEQRVKLFSNVLGLDCVCRAGKPFKKGYTKAAKLLKIKDFSRIAVIGDQLFSDILGGNMLGCYTIKVEPIDKTSDPLAVKVKRWFEIFVKEHRNQYK